MVNESWLDTRLKNQLTEAGMNTCRNSLQYIRHIVEEDEELHITFLIKLFKYFIPFKHQNPRF